MLHINYIEIFQGLPPQVAVFLISLLPITELRAAIPIALGVYKFSIFQAIFWSVIGNIMVAVINLYFLEAIYQFLKGKNKKVDKFFDWLFDRTRRKFSKKYEEKGAIALILFVAIPLPVTGAWTASLAAWLFGINKNKALLYISIGVIIAAGIVTSISLGLFNIF